MLTALLELTRNWPRPLSDLWLDAVDPDQSTVPALGPEIRSPRGGQALALAPQIDDLFPQPAGREARLARVAVRAGLLLWNDQFDAAHEAAQSIEGEGVERLGDYWHAILHRREPDYGNARYWLRRVGPHPVHTALDQWLAPRLDLLLPQPSDAGTPAVARAFAEETAWLHRVVSPRWNADALVSLCETCARSPDGSSLIRLAELLQATEMTLLMDHSLQAAQSD
jgi:hypothetical protein